MTAAEYRDGGDRGASTIELLVLGVPLLLVFGWVMVWGMAGDADSGVSTAARAAARAASQATAADAAQSAGRAAADQALSHHARHCTEPQVEIDTAGFAVPVGQPATVTVRVQCQVPLDQVSVPGVPGSRTISDEFEVSLDQYAERG